MRNMPQTGLKPVGRPFVYPIVHPLSSGKTEGLCAELPLIPHTFGSRRSTMRLISLTNLRTEPHGLSPSHPCLH